MVFFTDELDKTSVPMEFENLSDDLAQQVGKRLVSKDFSQWSQNLEGVHFCSRPIRLRGSSTTVDRSTGEILSSFGDDLSGGREIWIPCGNRRSTYCPACSRLYSRDMFEMIRTGMLGGKNVPEQVRYNPTVFLTLTAPSFGAVHGKRPNGKACTPRSNAQRCPHGRVLACYKKHQDGDECLGQPLCSECYDYVSHVVWQYYSPELWRRFTIQLRRTIAQNIGVKVSKIKDAFSIQFAKVAEFQSRGCIHFHALIRVDGSRNLGEFAAAPEEISTELLREAALTAAKSVKVTAEPTFPGEATRILKFGQQVDVKTVGNERLSNDKLSAEAVSGYIAKYSTKSADESFINGRKNAHISRLMSCVQFVGNHPHAPPVYWLLRKWVRELGFRGHFATKSSAYSITLGRLRRARKRFRLLAQSREASQIKDLDSSLLSVLLLSDELEDELPVVISQWEFVAAGWDSRADEVLAIAAAQAAMKYA